MRANVLDFVASALIGFIVSSIAIHEVTSSFTLPTFSKVVDSRNLRLLEKQGSSSTARIASDLHFSNDTITSISAAPVDFLLTDTLSGANNYLHAHLETVARATTLPRHESNDRVNKILKNSEIQLRSLYHDAVQQQYSQQTSASIQRKHHLIANTYIDMGAITSVGFDYDYTLMTYTNEFLSLLYDNALSILVRDKRYPNEMLEELKGKFDPSFSIKGLVVDLELGWITQLSYTHKVVEAWEGRSKVNSRRLFKQYHRGHGLSPTERKNRLQPLNDIYSTVECCLVADTVQFFLDRKIPYLPRCLVEDILSSIKLAPQHIQRTVVDNPKLYLGGPKPQLKKTLIKMKRSGKKLFFVSNSPFWYVNAGMEQFMGPDWRNIFEFVIVSADKPNFYTDNARPFREVSISSGRVEFTEVTHLEPGKVYAEGCVKELTRRANWCLHGDHARHITQFESEESFSNSPGVLYLGDSLFADLVDAKREFGWSTAAVVPELGLELELQESVSNRIPQQSIDMLLQTLRQVQSALGSDDYDEADLTLLDELEICVSKWRDEQTKQYKNPFGSVFRARFQPSLFAHSLRRFCDLYVTGVEALGDYSPQHRFYPEDSTLLGHEK